VGITGRTDDLPIQQRRGSEDRMSERHPVMLAAALLRRGDLLASNQVVIFAASLPELSGNHSSLAICSELQAYEPAFF
jgi:hypothetical protein